ncbi:hypothetical protein D9615_002746 [Tricholomella constricta]|uniref:3-beta hydroxysteroid dehydrogenase/isomerase domain-containing protein n=1 Tax=Tricholomella constricta TaxID=117010 RepID=A0A8H5HG69_9AGAR|nr:hypothetical protein D9615_002746 [Tricholomella constricta]
MSQASESSPSRGRHFVIGGAGFLGSHIVEALTARSNVQSLAVFDLVSPSDGENVDGVEYISGDIVDEEKLTEALKKTQPDVVYHTASPIHGLPAAIYQRVNEEGTRVVLSACQAAGVKKLVYTSSTGVVWTGADFAGVTEDQVSVPRVGYDAYHHTKALGERLVLNENGKNGMQVVVLRPCGMTGERDKQMIWRLAQALENGQQNVQIGNNKNLIDYLYVGNAAYAHILAADKLLDAPETVAGEVFFITNGTPMLQWDFNRLVWKELGDDGSKKIVVIPRAIGMLMAAVSEIWAKITGNPTDFTRFSVRFITGVQWYNIDKAKKLLGYVPRVNLEEGVRRTAQWWKVSGATQHKAQKDKSV